MKESKKYGKRVRFITKSEKLKKRSCSIIDPELFIMKLLNLGFKDFVDSKALCDFLHIQEITLIKINRLSHISRSTIGIIADSLNCKSKDLVLEPYKKVVFDLSDDMDDMVKFRPGDIENLIWLNWYTEEYLGEKIGVTEKEFKMILKSKKITKLQVILLANLFKIHPFELIEFNIPPTRKVIVNKQLLLHRMVDMETPVKYGYSMIGDESMKNIMEGKSIEMDKVNKLGELLSCSPAYLLRDELEVECHQNQ